MAGGARAAAPRRSWLWAQGLACGVVATTAAPLALMLGVLLAPSVIAAVVDLSAGRRVARIVLVYAAAAIMPLLQDLWRGAASWGMCLDTLADLRLLAIVWGAQAAGWLLSELGPLGVRLVLAARVAGRTARLKAERLRLQEDWGLAVADGAAETPPAERRG